MTCWKRAFLYLTRETRKSVRIMMVCFILSTLIILCGWVKDSTSHSATEVRQTVGASFTVSDNADGKYVGDELIDKIKSAGNIHIINGENLQLLYSQSIRPVPGMLAGSEDEGKFIMSYYSAHFTELMNEFQSGDFELIEGRHLTPDDTRSALISEDLAAENMLAVGDQFTAGYSPEMILDDPKLSGQNFTFTVTGIFKVNISTQISTPEPSMRENAVFIDVNSGHMVDAANFEQNRYRYGVTFFVDDPKYINETVANAEAMLDSSRYQITVDDKAYTESAKPLERLEMIMGVLIVAFTLVGILILTLVFILWMRQRIREIGIYFSLGLSKKNILGQFLIENITACVVGWMLSLAFSFFFVSIMHNHLGMLNHLSTSNLIATFALMFGITIISTALSFAFIIRFNPRKILLE